MSVAGRRVFQPWRSDRHVPLRGGISFSLVASIVCAAVLWLPATAFAAASNPALAGSVNSSTSLSGATSVAVSASFLTPNYAYSTAYFRGALTAIDISNPALPVIAGESASANSLFNGSTVNVIGGYAYVASKNRNGPSGSGVNDDGTGNSLTILDISTNPAQPLIVGSVRDPINLFGAYGIAVSGPYAYVAAQGCLTGQPCPNAQVGNSFNVVDISSPSSPTIVATLKNGALPAPWTGTGALAHATSVAVSGNFAYVTAAYSNRLTVIDISNPLSPTIVASLLDANKLDFPVDVAVSGGYAYVADQGTGLGRLAVVDVQTPSNPQVVGLITNTSTSLNGAYRVRVRGNFAYVSGSSASAVAAVDISNPLAPRFAGSFTSTTVLNKTTGLDVDSTGRFLIPSSPYLSSQSNPLYPPFPLQTGGPTTTGSLSAIDLDPVAIGVTIAPASKPTDPTTQTSASFTFSTSDAVASLRCRLDGAPFGFCTSASTQTYTSLSQGTHTFVVEATDAAGITATDTYTWTIVPGTPPSNTSLPTVSGTPQQGQTLTASPGTWSGSPAPTFTYQWQRCDSAGANCVNIVGATQSTYTPVSGDVNSTIRVVVTGTNTAGNSNASSAATAVVTASSGGGGPATGLLDDFNRPDNTGPPSASWSRALFANVGSNDFQISGSQITAMTGTTSDYWNAQQFGPGSEAWLTVAAKPTVDLDQIALGLRFQNPGLATGTGYQAYFQNRTGTDQYGIYRRNGGLTLINSVVTGPELQPGDQLLFRAVGSTLEFWLGHTGTWTKVVSVTDTTYTAGGYITVTAKNTAVRLDDFGGGSTTAAPTSPVNTSPPTVSGTAQQGQTLTAGPGTWTGSPAPAFTYQWQRCDPAGANCANIVGATQSTYTLVSGDVNSTVRVVVTGTNSAGNSSANSAVSGLVAAAPIAPANTSPPTVSGTAQQGQTLTASPGTWTGSPAPAFTYQWQRCDPAGANCANIVGATQSTYTLVSGDVNSTVRVVVTGTNSAGNSSANSAVSGLVAAAPIAPANTSPPTVSGTAQQGQTLTASPGTWTGSPAPTFTYQWQRCDTAGANCTNIVGATQSTYTLTAADVNSTVRVVVTGTNNAGNSSANSAATAVVTASSGGGGPVTALLDDFNRPDNTGPPSASWSRALFANTGTNDLQISGNQLTAMVGTTSDYWNAQQFGPDSEVWLTVMAKPTVDLDMIALGLRFQNPGLASGTGYQAYFQNRTSTDQYGIYKRNSSLTLLKSVVTGPELQPGDQLLFRATGSTLEFWLGHAGTWTKVITVTDTTYTAGGYVAITTKNTAVRLDDFGGGTLP